MTHPLACKGTATVQASLYCRVAPLATAAIVTKWQPGQTLDLWASVDGWALVQDQGNGNTGWSKVASADGTPYLTGAWTA